MKLQIGNYYYYAKCSTRFKCIEIGDEVSTFNSDNLSECKFYNEDIYTDMYNLIENRKKKINKILKRI